MKQKVLGLDLGTNSIGISVRDTLKSGSVTDQLEFFSSYIFPSGVGNEKGKEFSYAAQRTKFRSTRRLYQSRRYRIWNTLELLITNNCCPLTMEQLDAWRTYDKSKNLYRHYPTEAKEFEQWVRLDFDNDGIPEYSSPYQLRAELMERQFDFNDQIERYKLGRAIYHIAQRRGFKSSKGSTLQEQESVAKGEDYDLNNELQKSETEKSKGLVAYMKEHGCPTVGCAFYAMEKAGMRVRANEQMQAVRSMYEDEIKQIFTFQNGLSTESEFFKRIISKKKGEGTIFYKRPFRTQKGNVGKCTLEKNKSRCPISRPEFEQFRAWSLINNLRYKTNEDTGKAQRELPLETRKQLYEEKFIRVSNFKMADILKWLKKKDPSVAELNYDAQTTVMGSPVCARLKDILGADWMNAELKGYNYEELWHACFEVGDDGEEFVKDFAVNHLHADEALLNKMMKLWGSITQDYAALSLKAIRNILAMLQEGYIYSEAVVLAKLPAIFGDNWAIVKKELYGEWKGIQETIEHERQINKLANNLIAEYKVLDSEDQFALHNTDYQLDESDKKHVKETIIRSLSYARWKRLSPKEQETLLNEVANAYQQFFHSSERNYYTIRHLDDAVLDVIRDNFMEYVQPQYKAKIEQKTDVLYHPSDVTIYQPVAPKNVDVDGNIRNIKLLASPATNVFRNPMVMRVLHQLRNIINTLIKNGIIDDDNTSIVVETARELNDANMRSAIDTYQRAREKENDAYRKELEQCYPSRKITSEDIDKVRLWHEQGERCIYTGEPIKDIKQLLNDDLFEIEHTIPRSISFDDSLANKTICSYHYNRYTKKNLFPSQLPEADYAAIMERIEPWKEKIKSLKKAIITSGNKAKSAATKVAKDKYISERHVHEMELKYWEDKVSRFTATVDEWKQSFRNNQLNDTRIITKYAYHFLKTVFGDVTVQKGYMTASFRKALGIQSLEEKKDRNLHSHHAIDATMLTLIPANTKRDKLLELFYQVEELKKRLETDTTVQEELEKTEKLYNHLLASCDIKGVEKVTDFINSNILVQQRRKDQTLTPAHRKMRVRGKEISKDGKQLWITGDSLRGSLHKDSYFGAIRMGAMDDDGQKDLVMVARVPISSFKSMKDTDKIIDAALREYIVSVLQQRINVENMSFEEAVKQPIWMLDENGQEIKTDRNGRKLRPIRHVRCKVAAGRGYLSYDAALPIREQVYSSDKEYKNFVYAQNDINYLCLIYEGISKGKCIRKARIIDYLTVAKSHITDIKELISNATYSSWTDGKNQLELKGVLKCGTHVLLWEESPAELTNLTRQQLSQRLYYVYKFNQIGSTTYIYLQHHMEARPDNLIPQDECEVSIGKNQPRLKLSADKCKFLIEGKDNDFEFVLNNSKGIEFK